jgi:hypothetical protein
LVLGRPTWRRGSFAARRSLGRGPGLEWKGAQRLGARAMGKAELGVRTGMGGQRLGSGWDRGGASVLAEGAGAGWLQPRPPAPTLHPSLALSPSYTLPSTLRSQLRPHPEVCKVWAEPGRLQAVSGDTPQNPGLLPPGS